MEKILIIVESPSKALKIKNYLPNNYTVTASKGHITELAKGGKHGLGVDINDNFKPKYVLSDDKISTLDDIIKLSSTSDLIMLASDNDREGEAISWHLFERLKDCGKPFKRIRFNEIKKDKIVKAIKNAGDIDMNAVHSQEARRILDRLVGFMASPFLMNFFGPKLSAGRVQSVLTRMVIDRERAIEAFIPEDFWTIQTNLSTAQGEKFSAKFVERLTDLSAANNAKNSLDAPDYIVSQVVRQQENKNPQAPLVTSSLQRLMSKAHGFGADRTMKAAQTLYESGYCTYIRTDSVRSSDESITEVRDWLTTNKHTTPLVPHVYTNKDSVQDAHECIRPSDLTLIPNQNFAIIDPDEKLVYEAIWKYFVASQMMPAVYDTLAVTAHPVNNINSKVKSSGKALSSKGFLEIMGIDDTSSIDIPNLKVGEKVTLLNLKMDKKQTQPPPRFSEDKLIKELVNKNIGRPATYAELLSKICTRNYVEKRGNVYHATDLGKQITDELNKYFSFMNYDYTAKMEKSLDEIEAGKLNHIDMLKNFFPGFKKELGLAYKGHGSLLCEKCDSPMITKTSKTGDKFLGCTQYPSCGFTKNLEHVL